MRGTNDNAMQWGCDAAAPLSQRNGRTAAQRGTEQSATL